MTPRERVVAAMNGEAVFPVPTDVYENGVHRDLGRRLARHFGYSEQDIESLLTTFRSSIRWARPMYIGPELEEDKSGMHLPVYPATKIFRDFWGTWGESAATYYDGLPRPLRGAQTVADIDGHPWPDPDWFDYGRVGWFSTSPEGHLPIAEWSARNRDYAHLAGGWSPIFSRAMDMFGMETGLTYVVQRPDLLEATFTHIADFLEEYYRRFAHEARGHCEILAWGDDFASQQKLMLNPALWRKWFRPIWKRLFAIAHENGMKAAFHSCGAVRPVIGDLIDVGLDILENVQTTSVGMDPGELKREYGQHLTFYGAMDTQSILPRGTPEDVRREVRRLIDILGDNGHYIFTTSHFLLDDVPVENVVAMYEEANSYRG